MSPRPAPWRDERVIAAVAQVAIAVVALALLVHVAGRTLDDMRARGLVPGLGFLNNTAGFRIGEGGAFDPAADSNLAALAVGARNTLRVALVGIVAATALGFAVALGRLSENPLAGRLATTFVEVFRNTPLLVQLLFWYQGVVLALPPVQRSLALGAGDAAGGGTAWAYLSQRGLALPRPVPGAALPAWLAVAALGLAGAWLAARWRRAVHTGTGAPARGWAWAGGVGLGVAAAGWWLLGGPPATMSLPELQGRFNYSGGLVLSPEFTALTAGLSVYGASFIAEVIRGGILAVPHGQREAARAVGLGERQVLRLVVLPQALRVIIPPLTSQYLNLVKNSTLGIAVGYPDLFNVSLTIGNKTGQAVILILVVMGAYLAMSLVTSLAMNVYNRRTAWRER